MESYTLKSFITWLEEKGFTNHKSGYNYIKDSVLVTATEVGVNINYMEYDLNVNKFNTAVSMLEEIAL